MKVVVIGGGIVGNSLTGWLAELGWTEIVQIDKIDHCVLYNGWHRDIAVISF